MVLVPWCCPTELASYVGAEVPLVLDHLAARGASTRPTGWCGLSSAPLAGSGCDLLLGASSPLLFAWGTLHAPGRRGGWAAVSSSATGGQALPNYLYRRDGTSPVFALAVHIVVVIRSSPCILKVQFQERFDVVGQGPGLCFGGEMGNHIPRLVDGKWQQALPDCSENGLLIFPF